MRPATASPTAAAHRSLAPAGGDIGQLSQVQVATRVATSKAQAADDLSGKAFDQELMRHAALLVDYRRGFERDLGRENHDLSAWLGINVPLADMQARIGTIVDDSTAMGIDPAELSRGLGAVQAALAALEQPMVKAGLPTEVFDGMRGTLALTQIFGGVPLQPTDVAAIPDIVDDDNKVQRDELSDVIAAARAQLDRAADGLAPDAFRHVARLVHVHVEHLIERLPVTYVPAAEAPALAARLKKLADDAGRLHLGDETRKVSQRGTNQDALALIDLAQTLRAMPAANV